MIEKLVELSSADDLNQKYIVHFSYFAFCVSCSLVLVLFLIYQLQSVAIFDVIGLFLGLVGWLFCYKGNCERAKLLMPILSSLKILILSLFYFGESSVFHWLFINVIVYSVVVFRADQRFLKYSLVIGSIVLFLSCESLSLKGWYLTEEDQNIVTFFVFFCVVFYCLVIVSLILKRQESVNSYFHLQVEKDELTGLSTRRKALTDAVDIFTDSVNSRLSCVFAILDLDHFRKINNIYGPDAGDLVLTEVTKMIRSVIRPKDEVGRYGGDEFILIMPSTNLKQAEEVLENIRQSVEDTLVETDQGIIIPVTLSVGLASIAGTVARYEDVLAQADNSLYIAKRNGRNRIFAQSDFQN